MTAITVARGALKMPLWRGNEGNAEFRRWLERVEPLSESAAYCCAHSVVGKTHQHERDVADDCKPPGFDHPSIWNLGYRQRVLVCQPYGCPDEAELAAFDARWGTRSVIWGPDESWYLPKGTWLVETYSSDLPGKGIR